MGVLYLPTFGWFLWFSCRWIYNRPIDLVRFPDHATRLPSVFRLICTFLLVEGRGGTAIRWSGRSCLLRSGHSHGWGAPPELGGRDVFIYNVFVHIRYIYTDIYIYMYIMFLWDFVEWHMVFMFFKLPDIYKLIKFRIQNPVNLAPFLGEGFHIGTPMWWLFLMFCWMLRLKWRGWTARLGGGILPK